MICDQCHGKGWRDNPHADYVPEVVAHERGYDSIPCRKCGGSGFILSNADEIIQALDVAISTRIPLTLRELKQLKLALMK